jgi:hypothetical protein
LALHAVHRRRAIRDRNLLPYDNELRVTKKNGEFVFDGELGPPPDDDLQWPPFRSFGREYYTYQLLLDLKVDEEWAVRTEPHPGFYTDTTGTVPIAVPALLRTEWWPMISFVVFKSPPEGETHIFRPGEPMLQILILPVTADFTLAPMGEEEAAEREMRRRLVPRPTSPPSHVRLIRHSRGVILWRSPSLYSVRIACSSIRKNDQTKQKPDKGSETRKESSANYRNNVDQI